MFKVKYFDQAILHDYTKIVLYPTTPAKGRRNRKRPQIKNYVAIFHELMTKEFLLNSLVGIL